MITLLQLLTIVSKIFLGGTYFKLCSRVTGTRKIIDLVFNPLDEVILDIYIYIYIYIYIGKIYSTYLYIYNIVYILDIKELFTTLLLTFARDGVKHSS
jgi:hypothetical protein